jgi:hypothetical protein
MGDFSLSIGTHRDREMCSKPVILIWDVWPVVIQDRKVLGAESGILYVLTRTMWEGPAPFNPAERKQWRDPDVQRAWQVLSYR